MKHKFVIIISVLVLIAAMIFMAKDLFFPKESSLGNIYKYDFDKYAKIDSSHFCYEESKKIIPNTDYIYGIAIDDQDRLYVSGEKEVFIYDAKIGALISQFKTDSSAYCLSIDEKGHLYLGMPEYVEIRDIDGQLLQQWESINDSAIITSIAVNEESVFVADAGNKLVYHYNKKGQLLNTIGEKDTKNGIKGFIIPSSYFDLLLGKYGELWVVNPGYHALENYSPDGRLISSWEKTSMQLEGFSGCCNPSHIAMLSNGSFVTSEKGIERIKIHAPHGEFKCVVAGPDSFVKGTRDLDLAVDSEDRIFVADHEKGEIRIFKGLRP